MPSPPVLAQPPSAGPHRRPTPTRPRRARPHPPAQCELQQEAPRRCGDRGRPFVSWDAIPRRAGAPGRPRLSGRGLRAGPARWRCGCARSLGEPELAGDVVGAAATGHPVQHLVLPVCQRRERPRGRRSRSPRGPRGQEVEHAIGNDGTVGAAATTVSTTSRDGAVLSRYPWPPDCSAVTMSAWSSDEVSSSTRVSGTCSRTWRTRSAPLPSGSRRSTTTTSGRCCSTAFGPSTRLPTAATTVVEGRTSRVPGQATRPGGTCDQALEERRRRRTVCCTVIPGLGERLLQRHDARADQRSCPSSVSTALNMAQRR